MKQSHHSLRAIILALVLSCMTGCATTETQQTTGEYIDDTVITVEVKAAILNDPLTRLLEIDVETYQGEVQLGGFVSSQEAIDRVVEVTRSVNGVTAIKNDMLLSQP